MPDAVEPIG
jgi:hypothetical protein